MPWYAPWGLGGAVAILAPRRPTRIKTNLAYPPVRLSGVSDRFQIGIEKHIDFVFVRCIQSLRCDDNSYLAQFFKQLRSLSGQWDSRPGAALCPRQTR